MINEHTADWWRHMHPHRLRYEVLSDKNPLVKTIAPVAEQVRAHRRPVADDNPFLALQNAVSQQIIEALDRYRDVRDWFSEALFMSVYGSPILQSLVGLRSDGATARQRIGRDVARKAEGARMFAEAAAQMQRGGLREAATRAMLYIGLARPEQAVDERGFAALREFREQQPESERLPLARFKQLVREQYLLLCTDAERAIAAIPELLPDSAAERGAAVRLIRRVASAAGRLSAEGEKRLARIEALFEAGPRETATGTAGESWEVTEEEGRAPVRERRRGETMPGDTKREEKTRAP
jgi:hypothetical protein